MDRVQTLRRGGSRRTRDDTSELRGSRPALASAHFGVSATPGTPQRGLLVLGGLTGGAANVCFASGMMIGDVVRVMLLFYLTPSVGDAGGPFLSGRKNLSASRFRCWFGSGRRGVGVGRTSLAEVHRLRRPICWGSARGSSTPRRTSRFARPIASLFSPRHCRYSSDALWFLGLSAWRRGSGMSPVTFPLAIELLAFAALWVGAAMWTTMYGVTHLEAGRAGVLLVFELVAAVVSAMLIRHERLAPMEWLGASMILTAALIDARSSVSA